MTTQGAAPTHWRSINTFFSGFVWTVIFGGAAAALLIFWHPPPILNVPLAELTIGAVLENIFKIIVVFFCAIYCIGSLIRMFNARQIAAEKEGAEKREEEERKQREREKDEREQREREEEEREREEEKKRREILREKMRPKWRELSQPPARCTPAERLQKLKEFVEVRCGGSVYNDGIPSEVGFALPEGEPMMQPILKKLRANKNIGGTGEPVQIKPIDFPRRPAAMGRMLTIDLLSIEDDELEQITQP
jgi:hypothetical protein